MTNSKRTDSADIAERFWPKVDVRGPDECWPWKASLKTGGYGQLRIGGRNGRCGTAHRIAYTLNVGAIPAGLHVLHSCDVRHCCNPRHLRLGTNADNMRDMADRGRSRAAGRGRVLTMQDAREIRAFVGPKPRRGVIAAVARQYGAEPTSVRKILRCETYREALPSTGLASADVHEVKASKEPRRDDGAEFSAPHHQPTRERAQAT